MFHSRSTSGRALLAVAAAAACIGAAQATTIYSGTLSIAATDPVQSGRLNATSTPQTWAGTETFLGLLGIFASYHYKVLDLNLSALEAGYVEGRYIQIFMDSPFTTTFLAGYRNSYTPGSAATVQATWLGDIGTVSPSPATVPAPFQVKVGAGDHLLLVINELSFNGGLNQPANILVEAFSDDSYTDLALAVPEPTSLACMGLGIAALAMLRRRRRAA